MRRRWHVPECLMAGPRTARRSFENENRDDSYAKNCREQEIELDAFMHGHFSAVSEPSGGPARPLFEKGKSPELKFWVDCYQQTFSIEILDYNKSQDLFR